MHFKLSFNKLPISKTIIAAQLSVKTEVTLPSYGKDKNAEVVYHKLIAEARVIGDNYIIK